MKKILLLLFALIIGTFMSFAIANDESASVLQFFNKYVQAGNSYSSNFFSFFVPNPKIIRIVIKPDGTKQAVNVPFAKYKKEASLGMKVGKIVKYSNSYSDIKVTKDGVDYKVTAMRKASASDYSLPAYFIIGKNSQGEWKMKVESMETKVQKFLNNK
ncbi:MAG: hypothetical protein PHV37_08395 [Candidatus Gastranaerophilales bacterium]|nr:hypothetical protein [Candidatus Gastranaerophilales bacterium]